jgi:hypothetical protein
MVVPGVNGSIIANSNAPTGSRLKGAYKNSKNSKKRKMPNGGSVLSMGDYDRTTAPKKGNYLLPDINRPGYTDFEGGRRTEYKIGVNIDGKETLLPTVVGGKQLTEDEAINRYYKTGLHMGKFNTPQEADYASRLRTARYNMLEEPVRFKANQFKDGGWDNWTPNVGKPYLRTSPAGNAGYTDNTKVVTQNTNVTAANRKAAEAGEYARKVGSVTQGKVKSDYEKAREATSFVSQAEQRKGSADPLDHVLDMVNPASLAFAATDLVGNTGSAVSNVAQGNFKEAGSDLLNAGMNALQVIPAAKTIKPFGSSILKGVSKYADDVVQTSKIAGKPALPTYKNVYRTEHANFNKAATPNDLTGRWALDDLRGSEFYVNNLKTPQGEGFVTKNYFKGEVEPVRMMRDRLPEYKMKQQFAEGMPEEARIMSMGKGKLTDQEFASVLGDGAIDRMRTGKLTEMDYNTMSTAPFMYNTSEGILDANRVNQLRQGENTFLGRGKTSLFPDQKKAIDYIKDQSEGQKNASSFSKYLPFSTYERGGKIDHSDDKDMVNGVASILRRVESKSNRLKLANQLSKQFNREKVKYDLPSFLAKSKVKK